VEFREAADEDQAKRIWLGRKSAFGAMGQINDYMCLDGTIPVSSLPHVLKRIGEMSGSSGSTSATSSTRATATCTR
jgi:glycolate oxidase